MMTATEMAAAFEESAEARRAREIKALLLGIEHGARDAMLQYLAMAGITRADVEVKIILYSGDRQRG